mmetsp:Transcript_118136/g.294620  ORF Transcript_118136/g.294620 Transcript_118136/m.294620 type:complete len:213 (-) Transcript_118136:659-1297(-)
MPVMPLASRSSQISSDLYSQDCFSARSLPSSSVPPRLLHRASESPMMTQYCLRHKGFFFLHLLGSPLVPVTFSQYLSGHSVGSYSSHGFSPFSLLILCSKHRFVYFSCFGLETYSVSSFAFCSAIFLSQAFIAECHMACATYESSWWSASQSSWASVSLVKSPTKVLFELNSPVAMRSRPPCSFTRVAPLVSMPSSRASQGRFSSLAFSIDV